MTPTLSVITINVDAVNGFGVLIDIKISAIENPFSHPLFVLLL